MMIFYYVQKRGSPCSCTSILGIDSLIHHWLAIINSSVPVCVCACAYRSYKPWGKNPTSFEGLLDSFALLEGDVELLIGDEELVTGFLARLDPGLGVVALAGEAAKSKRDRERREAPSSGDLRFRISILKDMYGDKKGSL